jgi:multidrug resistance protein
MSLLHGPFSDALGRKRVILAGVAVFALASIGCALSGSIGALLGFRALQGISAGAGLIVGRAIIRDCFEGVEAQRLMSTVSMIFGIAPAIAPIVGGWVVAVAHWSMIFWLLAAFAAALWLACMAWLPETHPVEQRVPLSIDELASSSRAISGNAGKIVSIENGPNIASAASSGASRRRRGNTTSVIGMQDFPKRGPHGGLARTSLGYRRHSGDGILLEPPQG